MTQENMETFFEAGSERNYSCEIMNHKDDR